MPQFNTANHQYDTSDFDALVGAIAHGYLSPDQLPAVSFLKAPGYQDGHAGYSDPARRAAVRRRGDQRPRSTRPTGRAPPSSSPTTTPTGGTTTSTAASHNPSNTSAVATPPGPQDFLTGTGLCGDTVDDPPLAGQSGRCGYGPRLPLLVISPWAKPNFVDHTLTDQSSITKFVEDNWKLPTITGSFATIAGSLNNMFDFKSHAGKRPKLFLDPITGQGTGGRHGD